MNISLRSAAPRALFLLALALIVLSVVALGWRTTANGSSHREAPLISLDPSADVTDVYAFISPDKTDYTTLIANWIPFEEPAGGPNFYHFADADLARYWIKVDNDGDAACDIGFLFTFHTQIQNGETFLYNTGPIAAATDSTFNYRQTYDVVKYTGDPCETGSATTLASDKIQPPDYVGKRSTKPYSPLTNHGVYPVSGGGQVFAGQRDDPFFVDIGAIFDLGGLRPFNSFHIIPLKNGVGRDNVAGFNIHSTALQLPTSSLVTEDCDGTSTDRDCVIGVWATADRAAITTRSFGDEVGSGGWVQVSRLGNPLVNEAVVPLALKDAFNGLDPSQDFALFNSGTQAGELFKKSVLDPELGRLIPALYESSGIEVPAPPRNDIVQVFLTGVPGLNEMAEGYTPAEYLRLNTGIAPTAGVCQGDPLGVLAGDNAGFPNGRRLEDDVTDSALKVVAGVLVPGFNIAPNNLLGDGVGHNDRLCLGYFPYMAAPWSGYQSTHATKGNVPPKAADDANFADDE